MGNTSIAGHRTTYGAPFNRIDELVPGDEIVVTGIQGEFTYRVIDPRKLSTLNIKPHPSLFVQNSELGKNVLNEEQENIWIDNSVVPESWLLTGNNIITGIPANDWEIVMPEGTCLV